MHPVIYYMILFVAVGGIGMAAGNRKVEATVSRLRWLKYFTYVLITGSIIAAILLHYFYWVAWFISLVSLAELSIVNKRLPLKNVMVSLIIFLAVATGFIFFSVKFNDDFLVFTYFQVLIFDGFCQIAGQLFGRHPLAPSISPTKTWEGLAGGWSCCIIAAVIGQSWMEGSVTSTWFGILSGGFTGIIAFFGDLIASFYKRKAGVKDYSHWLPGQGGFLDRFDSFLFAGAVYFLLYIVIFKGEFTGITR